MKEMIQLVHKAFAMVTPALAKSCVAHCNKIMERDMEAEKIIDINVVPLVIDMVRNLTEV